MEVICTWRFEIVGIKGNRREVTDRWEAISKASQHIAHRAYALWEKWHTDSGTHLLLWKHQRVCDLLKISNRGKSEEEREPFPPPPTVAYWPNDFHKQVDDALKSEFPFVSKRLISYITRDIRSKLKGGSQKIPGMTAQKAILLGAQGRPNLQVRQPILFDGDMCSPKHVPFTPIENSQNFAMSIATERTIPQEGKSYAYSPRDEFEIKARKCGYHVIKKIVDGEYTFVRSAISWDERKDKWFVYVTFERAPKFTIELDKTTSAILRPQTDIPFRLFIGERAIPINGDGKIVEVQRLKIRGNIIGRSQMYREAPTPSRKGHGRKRAIQSTKPLSPRWNRFTANYNREVARKVANIVKEHDCGIVVLEIPQPSKLGDCFLCKAGNLDHDPKRSQWKFDQLAQMLNHYKKDYNFTFEKVQLENEPDSKPAKKVRRMRKGDCQQETGS